ncbi:MAG: rod shape-determining protein MreC [candidate division Zixibacteria bacterium]
MDWQSSWLKEKQAAVHTVAILLIAIFLLITSGGVSIFICNVTSSIFYYPFQQIKNSLTILADKQNINEALNIKLAELSVQLQLFNETTEENRRLRSLLGFVPPPSFRIIPAEIIGVSGSNIPNTVLINLGASDSIKVNQTIINQNGVAGRVGEVLEDYATVYLLTEPRCRVAARVKRSREQGIIRYSLSKGLYLDNLPQQGDVAVGDTVITSGLGGIFPEGLVIGIIKEIETPEKEFFYDIQIDPAVNFNGLDELYVLARQEGA